MQATLETETEKRLGVRIAEPESKYSKLYYFTKVRETENFNIEIGEQVMLHVNHPGWLFIGPVYPRLVYPRLKK